MALIPGGNSRPQNPEAQMELVEHLAELRNRIIRCALYIVIGMVVTYNLYDRIFTILAYPLAPILQKVGGVLVITGIQDGFLLRMQVSFLSGLVVAIPLVVLELWGFISPALTPEERKPVKYLAPFSVLLFLAGVAVAYASLPTAYGWMASYIPDIPPVPGGANGATSAATLFQNAQQYLLLTVKILLAFGVAFQLPIVLLFLARVGLITAGLMTTYWRHAVVIIATAAAILTPSNDPLTMLMMAVPMAGLYLLSIGLVRAFEPRADGSRSGPSFAAMMLVALAPISIVMASGYWLWRSSPFANAVNTAPIPARRTTAAAPNPEATPMPGSRPDPAPIATPTVVPLDAPTNRAETRAVRREIEKLRKRIAALEAKRK
ncbi:MAG: twin-arginine translocase subunit TatC [Cytophagales bacterium]|nr:twin-arginine translocase subunit TatC [Armatimonadota bacterium]